MTTKDTGTKDGAAKKRPWTAAEAEEVLAAWQDSGLSIHAFAKARGFDADRLYYWRRRRRAWREEKESEKATSGIPLVPVIAAMTVENDRRAPAVICGLPVGIKIEIDDLAAVPPAWVWAFVRQVMLAAS